MSLVLLAKLVGNKLQVFQARFIKERYSAEPVAACHIAGTIAGDIVLTARKVPHEITPVHVMQLVAEEELKVLAKSWLVDCCRLESVALIINKCGGLNRQTNNILAKQAGIIIYMVGTVNAREKHIGLGSIFN